MLRHLSSSDRITSGFARWVVRLLKLHCKHLFQRATRSHSPATSGKKERPAHLGPHVQPTSSTAAKPLPSAPWTDVRPRGPTSRQEANLRVLHIAAAFACRQSRRSRMKSSDGRCLRRWPGGGRVERRNDQVEEKKRIGQLNLQIIHRMCVTLCWS